MTRQDHIEEVARAIWEAETNVAEHIRDDAWNKRIDDWNVYIPDTVPWNAPNSMFKQKGRDELYKEATAAISALEKLGAYVPEGWEAVPSEPTTGQIHAALLAHDDCEGAGWEQDIAYDKMLAACRAMLAAKPKPAQGKE